MEHFELIDKLEPSEGIHTIPDNAKIRILTADGYVFDILGISYEEQSNTVWLKAEVAE